MNLRRLAKITDGLSDYGKQSASSLYEEYKDLFDAWSEVETDDGIIASDEGEGYTDTQYDLYTGCNPRDLAELCVWAHQETRDDIIGYAEYFTGVDISKVSSR